MSSLHSLFFSLFFLTIFLESNVTAQSENYIKTLIDSAYVMEATDPELAIALYNKVISIASRLDDDLNKGRALSYIALVHMALGEYDSLYHYNKEALHFYKKEGYEKGIASIYNNEANAYLYQGFYKHAISLYQQALPYYEVEGEERNLTVILNNIASLFQHNKNHKESIRYLERALVISKKLNDPHTLGNTYNNLSAGLIAVDKIQSAYQYADSAVYNINQTDDIEMQIKIEGNQSRIAAQLGASAKALNLLNSIKLKNRKIEKLELDIVVDQTAAVYHQSKGQHTEAISHGLSSLQKLQISKDANYEMDVLRLLRDEYQALGNYKEAFKYANQLDSVKSVSYFSQSNRQVLELEELYQSNKKDAEISIHLLELEQRKNQNTVLVSFLLFLGLGSIITLLFFRNKKRIIEHRSAQQKQEIKRLRQSQKLAALDFIVQGQEEERTRIAQDLHDGLGSMLSSIRLQVKSIQEDIDSLAKVNIAEEAEQMITHACNEVRRISHDMMPAALASLGFIDTIEDLVVDMKAQSSLDVRLLKNGDFSKISEKIKINLYRIIQEASNNVVQHANATEFEITLTNLDNKVSVSLVDNGIGLETNHHKNSDGIGLRNIKSRVEYLGGKVEIDSSKGTAISFTIWLSKKEES